MKYTLTWQDFMRQPENKLLKESKGIHACKHKFIQEQNKLMWNDPIILQEAQSPGQSVTSNAAANYGGSTQFVTGNSAEVSTFTFAGLLNQAWTGSSLDGAYFDIEAYNNTTDFSRNHVDSMKTFRCYYTSQSLFAPTVPSSIHGIVTASSIGPVGTSGHFSSSLAHQWQNAINDQVATALVAGFTNTIAPGTLFSAVTSSKGQVLTITNVNKGSVNAISTTFASTTASVATSTTGLDTFHNEQGKQTFDGDRLPYASMPRKQN